MYRVSPWYVFSFLPSPPLLRGSCRCGDADTTPALVDPRARSNTCAILPPPIPRPLHRSRSTRFIPYDTRFIPLAFLYPSLASCLPRSPLRCVPLPISFHSLLPVPVAVLPPLMLLFPTLAPPMDSVVPSLLRLSPFSERKVSPPSRVPQVMTPVQPEFMVRFHSPFPPCSCWCDLC